MKITKTKGFSLIEMMIVIAILGIVAMIASYSWQRYVNNANLRSAARDLQSDMANAKQKAIMQGLHYHINIDVSGNSYTIEQWNATDTASITVSPAKKPSDQNRTGVKIDGNTYGDIITFEPRGTSSQGSVTLTNNRGSTAQINSNITGKTYVTFNIK